MEILHWPTPNNVDIAIVEKKVANNESGAAAGVG